MMALDPKGLEAARELPGTNHEAIIREYLSTITPAEAGGLVERLRSEAHTAEFCSRHTTASLMAEAATALAAKDAELAHLRRMLFPYADATKISGMSWNGFYLIGDEASVKELRRIEHRSAQLETYSAAYEERLANERGAAERAEAQRDEALKALDEIGNGCDGRVDKDALPCRIARRVREAQGGENGQ